MKSDDTKSMAALRQFREALAPTLSERRVARDARDEKSADFEKTETWSALKRTYEAIRKKEPEYARLPEVTLKGPKLRKPLSTAWFAQSVDKRYQACLERAR